MIQNLLQLSKALQDSFVSLFAKQSNLVHFQTIGTCRISTQQFELPAHHITPLICLQSYAHISNILKV